MSDHEARIVAALAGAVGVDLLKPNVNESSWDEYWVCEPREQLIARIRKVAKALAADAAEGGK